MDYMAHYENSPRMWSQGLHAHDYYEIYVHLEGGHHYCVDDQVYELKPNQLLLIPPLHMHGLVCERDLVDYERCYLYLSPEMIHKCDLDRINLSEFLDSSIKKRCTLSDLSLSEATVCKENMQSIEKFSIENINKEKKIHFEIYSKIFEILQIVCDHIKISSANDVYIPGDNPTVEILHYINEHFTENISIEDISHKFNMSESSISHKFKKYANKSIYEYILYKRIIMAKELMYSDLSLTEIAFKCGFYDYSNFLRVFIKQTNKTPKEYRTQVISG